MPFAICGVTEVPAFQSYPIDHIISIRETHQPGPDIRGFKNEFTLHSFCFADTNDAGNSLAPSTKMIDRLLTVFDQTESDQTVLFHCFAGVSRSSAAAFLWLVYIGMGYEKAYQTVVDARGPFVSPNELMIKLADPLMNQDGKMAKFITAEVNRRAPEREAYFKTVKTGGNIIV